MKFTVLSGADASYQELQRLTSQTLIDYSQMHGYECIVCQWSECERPTSWYKIPAILKTFSQGSDCVLWVDCDAIIVNAKIALQTLLRPTKHLGLSFTTFGPSCGVMLLRNSTPVRQLLELAWQQAQFLNHPWWEQKAIVHLFDTRQFDWSLIQWLPEDVFNCEWYWSGSFIHHLPNTPNGERLRRFRQILGLESSNKCG